MGKNGDLQPLPARRAIVFADLVESVRLYERFEARTIDRWRRFAAQARDQVAPSHGGRLVRTAGDGLLFEFETAAGATSAALALHRALAAYNGPDAGEAAMWLRVGVHVADVVADENELWGSGVNLAARLASLAQPGQTAASIEVRSGLSDGVQARLEDLGPRYMKHVGEPVRVFLLHAPDQPVGMPVPSSADLRPAVAVVPFVAMPADPAHDALGHAMADDIIASLSRHPGMRVLSRASTAAVRGVVLDLARLRELLGASFLLSGHFYVRGSRIRLAAELCELGTGHVLWAGSTSGDVDALFDGGDELVPHLVTQVSQQVLAHELARVRSLPMDSLASYSLMLGATGLLNSFTVTDFGRAREVLEHLNHRHPRQAMPAAMLSNWHSLRAVQGWSDKPEDDHRLAADLARRAMDTDPDHPDALVAEGRARVFAQGDYATAAHHFRRALDIHPNHVAAMAQLSESLSEAGQHAEAVALSLQAIDLSPLDPRRHVLESWASRAAYMAQLFEQAEVHARASIRQHLLHAPAHRLLIAALWQQGRHEQAQAAAARYMQVLPESNVCGSAPNAEGRFELGPFARILHSAGVPL